MPPVDSSKVTVTVARAFGPNARSRRQQASAADAGKVAAFFSHAVTRPPFNLTQPTDSSRFLLAATSLLPACVFCVGPLIT